MVLVDRHVAPAQDPLALDAHVALDHVLELGPDRRVVREEAHADPVLAGRRQLDAGDGAQERVGELDEDARAVARADVGALGPAVLEVVQRLERAADDLVGLLVVQARHHGDAAGVVLEPGVVEALCLGRRGVVRHLEVPVGGQQDCEVAA